ncbi:MAG: preprotein translocase subunit SecG [Planctomycetes bacterium]|nr:preprotein translocase subunit SecG [Planctomycetota bacterium]
MFLAEVNATLLTLLGIVFVLNAIVLIVFVLFRQSDTGGVGAAFGGGDGGGALGTKGQAVADKVIAFMGFTFIVLALAYSLVSTGGRSDSGPGPAATETPSDSGSENK